jgi:hypothetical protein
LRELVALDVGAGPLEEGSELSVVAQAVTRSVVFEDTQQAVTATMENSAQCAVLVAMVQDVIVSGYRHLTHGAQAPLLS